MAEEIFNRGFFINLLRDAFSHRRLGLWFAAGISVLSFPSATCPIRV